MYSQSTDVARTLNEEPTDPAGSREVGIWLTHFGRTRKTCRLYDVNNPTVVRFREELYQGLRALLDRFGDIALEIASREISLGSAVVYRASSRDDNLAAIFHRDGIRRITFLKEIGAAELDSFLDLVLHVTGQAGSEDDLVTLLWETELPGIAIIAAPIEGDVDGTGEEGDEGSSPLPWPGGSEPSPNPASDGASGPKESTGEKTRSDDWDVLARFANLDEAFDELESSAIQEVARLQQAYDADLALPVITRTLGKLADCLAIDTTPDDREELTRFVPRILREAIAMGDWQSARTALGMLRACDPEWSAAVFIEGLTAGPSIGITRKAVAALDTQGDHGVQEFLAFAMEFGEASLEWLILVLAESEQQRTRRPLTRTIAVIARECPERLLPWMSDERWYVVRNVVHILGWIGGDKVAGYLQAAIHHPEDRVRREVVAALGSLSPDEGRPILMSMLSTAESRLFTTILHQLSLARAPMVAQRLTEMLRDDRFSDRPDDEKRAVYSALASQGDSVLHALEEELQRGGLFAHGLDGHWGAVARCIARIGSPAARDVLQRGSRSSKAGVRKGCERALASLGANDD